jgi:tryptophanyl-tRNA synthetase
MAPIRDRARELREHPDRVHEILADGATRARVIARVTLEQAYERMGLDTPVDE